MPKLLKAGGVLLLAGLLPCPAAELNHPTGVQGLLLIDKLGSHIRFFDPVTYVEQASLRVPANPHDFVLSADHQLAYVPIYGDGVYGRNAHPGHEIKIIDLAARKLAGTIDVAPYRAPWDSDRSARRPLRDRRPRPESAHHRSQAADRPGDY